jgi:FkbM family methyltransferase
MKLSEFKNKYFNKKITKKYYIKKNFENYYSRLHELSDFINQTDIKKIEITDSELAFISKKYGVKVYVEKGNYRSAPLECLNFGDYEEKELQVILQLTPRKGNFFDIGANIGWHSLIVAKFYKKLKVYSFEPIKKTYDLLIKNIKSNFLKNIEAFNFAFFNKTKDIIFYKIAEDSGNSSIKNLFKKNFKTEKCKAEVLDNFVLKKKIKIDFIKCDIEGAELFLFLGAKIVLAEHKPIIMCEILRKWCKKFKYNPNQIILFLKKFGYKCFIFDFKNSKNLNKKIDIDDRGGEFFKKILLEEIKKITKKTIQTNFLFLNEVKHNKIIKKFF